MAYKSKNRRNKSVTDRGYADVHVGGMGRAQINQTISGAPSPAPPPYFDSGVSLQCQVQVFYFWWRLFTVFCCLLPFAIAGACYWFWRKYLRDNRQVKEFLRDPTKWCFRDSTIS